MHTIPEVVIRRSGVTFIAKPGLCSWVETQSGAAYWFHTLEAIVATMRPEIDNGTQQVELYGVSHTERVYAKLRDGEFPSQQEWTLQFARGTARLSRLR
ncbi:MAG TPA: hypothetical protein DEF00_01950 [Candidatus Taylorbacteria bacterium]|nr:MAG: hypothetical protein UY03_C0019G0019 [Parcubacteria group bacterium GW2011_GWA2_47_64]KKU95652.1 MAG: hypothetical protein UY29_C0022G0020 [Parcubacteria group bacterium GW2011_GWC2_48_17]HBV01140.1 hypothetical protein [Candidatus Taylorbacteria bacterium]